MIKSFVLLVLFTMGTLAQGTYEIPAALASDKSSLAHTTLSELRALNPFLIPLYLNYLQNRYVHKINSNDSNFFNVFNSLQKKFLAERSIYALKEIGKVKERVSPGIEASYIASRLKDISFSSQQTETMHELEITNQNYYFLYDELAGNGEPYNESLNYSSLSSIAVNEKIKYYKQIYSGGPVKDSINNLAEDALKHSYLFKNSYILSPELTSDIELNSYLEKVLHQLFHEDFSIMLSAGIPFYNNIVPVYQYNDFWSLAGSNREFNRNVIMLPVGAGIKIPLREHKSMFSSIELHLDYFFLLGLSEKVPERTELVYMAEPVYGTTWNQYRVLSKKDVSTNFITAEVKVPVYFLFRNFYLSTGANYYGGSILTGYQVEHTNPGTGGGPIPYYIEKGIKPKQFGAFLSVDYEWSDIFRMAVRYDTRGWPSFKFSRIFNLF